GGTVSLAMNYDFFVGIQPGVTGTYTMAAGSLTTYGDSQNGDGDQLIGYEGAGIFNQTGGTNTLSHADLVLGQYAGSVGTYNLSGGLLSVGGGLYVGGGTPNVGPGGMGVLTISNTGVLQVNGVLQVWGPGTVNISGTVPKIGALSIASGGLVNVNSGLLITSDAGNAQAAEASILAYIDSGAIGSTFAQSTPGYSLAYADGSDMAVADVNLHPGQVIIEPDLLGDADMNGIVNFHDLQILLSNFGQPGFWDQGNFNQHFGVDFNDLQLLLGNFGDSTTQSYSELTGIENLVGGFGDVAIANADGTGFTLVAVPEPATSMLMTIAGIGLLARRRRRTRIDRIGAFNVAAIKTVSKQRPCRSLWT
ncbi:MAG TPA: PEP-CTERM sorting domain-containing protein, partial [Tepidisphaeraceae bacterium]|nr:PEP-CTERM sorting domain-containing protein [Tepidisphaeraceae bacterium]